MKRFQQIYFTKIKNYQQFILFLNPNLGQVSHLSMVKTKLEQTLDELEDNLDR